MRATLTIEGFGFDPDDAIADMRWRCERHIAAGWLDPTAATVHRGINPYAHPGAAPSGYIAVTTLTKVEGP